MGSQKIFRRLFEKAIKREPVARCRTIAALVRRNKILAIGNNSYSSSVLSRRFKKHEHAIYVHAEISAIHSFLKKYPTRDLSECDLYIVRAKLNNNGKWIIGKSTPCTGCSRCIKYFKIRKVYSL